MNREVIKARCDRVLLEKTPAFSKVLNARIQRVYKAHEESLGSEIDYKLLTDFTSALLTAFSGVMAEVMVQTLSELLSDDDFEDSDW